MLLAKHPSKGENIDLERVHKYMLTSFRIVTDVKPPGQTSHVPLISIDELPIDKGVYFLEASNNAPIMNSVFLCSIESFAKHNPGTDIFVLINSKNANFKTRSQIWEPDSDLVFYHLRTFQMNSTRDFPM